MPRARSCYLVRGCAQPPVAIAYSGCGTSLAVGEWLRTYVFPVGGLNVTAEEAYAVVRLSTLDLLHRGDYSGRLESRLQPDCPGNVQALLDSGLRFALFIVARRTGGGQRPAAP